MLNRQEIYNKSRMEANDVKAAVYDAMDVHAEQMAIGFQKWLMQIKAVYQSQTKDYYVTADISKDDIYLTAEQLYQLYLEYLKIL